MNYTLTADYAISALSRGKRGTLGILKAPDGSLEFLGLGTRARVVKIWLVSSGCFYDETTFNHQLICRKGKGTRTAWGILTSENWQTIAASTEPECDLSCIAIINATRDDEDGNKVPFCVKIRFNREIAAIAAAWDAEICKLWLGEGQELKYHFAIPADIEISNDNEICEENLEWENQYGMN